MQLLWSCVGRCQPAVEGFSSRFGKLVRELASVPTGPDGSHEPIALEALKGGIDLPDIDFPGPSQHGLKTVFHLVAVQRFLRQEPQHAELKRHYPYSVCMLSMHALWRLSRCYFRPAGWTPGH